VTFTTQREFLGPLALNLAEAILPALGETIADPARRVVVVRVLEFLASACEGDAGTFGLGSLGVGSSWPSSFVIVDRPCFAENSALRAALADTC